MRIFKKIIKFKIVAVVLALQVLLSGCPYEEFYKPYYNKIQEAEIEIYPSKVFYSEWRKGYKATLILNIKNTTNKPRIFHFDSSFITFHSEKFTIKNIVFEVGKILNSSTETNIESMATKNIGLIFEGKLPHEKGDIILNLFTGKEFFTIPYKRIRK